MSVRTPPLFYCPQCEFYIGLAYSTADYLVPNPPPRAIPKRCSKCSEEEATAKTGGDRE